MSLGMKNLKPNSTLMEVKVDFGSNEYDLIQKDSKVQFNTKGF